MSDETVGGTGDDFSSVFEESTESETAEEVVEEVAEESGPTPLDPQDPRNYPPYQALEDFSNSMTPYMKDLKKLPQFGAVIAMIRSQDSGIRAEIVRNQVRGGRLTGGLTGEEEWLPNAPGPKYSPR